MRARAHPDAHADADDDGSGDGAGSVSFDPFADLLLGLIAILVPVISLLLSSGASAPAVQERAPSMRDGGTALRVTATAAGIRIEADALAQAHAVPPARILDDAELARRLRRSRDEGQPLALDIAADGLEAAFLFEAVAARNGPPVINQRRLEAGASGGAP